jgi:hypothetical protein
VQPLLQHGGRLEHQHGVSVGRSFGNRVDANHPAGAGAVHDHPWLLEPLREFSGKHATDGIDAAAGGNRHDERDRARIASRRLREHGRSGSGDDGGDHKPGARKPGAHKRLGNAQFPLPL